MNQALQKDTKEQIMSAFNKLLTEYQKTESKVATKEEEAEKEKNQQLLTTVADYTVDNIVNGMASLQLDFGNTLKNLAETITTESTKLGVLKKAIAIEKEHLEQLRKVRLVADSLYILRQEHQERLTNLQEQTNNQQETLEKEKLQTRKSWSKEQQEFTAKTTEIAELIASQREQEKADYNYEITRKHQLEMDAYEEAKRKQERKLQEANQEKEKAWQEREKILADKKKEFTENQQKIEGFEEKLKQEYNKAKGEAIKDADKDAKVKADLFEKEWEATKQGYELTIQSLTATIQKQTEQIAEITSQLQAATNQAQNLALRAFQSTAGNSANK